MAPSTDKGAGKPFWQERIAQAELEVQEANRSGSIGARLAANGRLLNEEIAAHVEPLERIERRPPPGLLLLRRIENRWLRMLAASAVALVGVYAIDRALDLHRLVTLHRPEFHWGWMVLFCAILVFFVPIAILRGTQRARRSVIALVALLALAAPGDRVFAVAPALMQERPLDGAAPVRGLLPGDELVWMEIGSEDDLVDHKPPPGWILVQTIDVPSDRFFRGWVKRSAVGENPLPAARRIKVLHEAIDAAISELAERQKPFADLRDQIFAWKAKNTAQAAAEVQRLATQLSIYMDTQVMPRALDIQDALSELRDLQDPGGSALTARFDKLARGFQP